MVELERFQKYIMKLVGLDSSTDATFYPGLSMQTWYNSCELEFAQTLENSYHIIKNEFLDLLGGPGFQSEQDSIQRDGEWNVYFLYERGKKNHENCERCPQTTAIIESSPYTMRTQGGMIYFSALAPRTRIYPHAGRSSLRVRCQLALQVPEGCGIRVNLEERTWTEGKCLIFNDCLTHEAWNNGNQTRIVLIVDMWNPSLTDIEITALKGLDKYVYYHAERMLSLWKKNEQGRKDNKQKWLV